jgi:type I restriction enzyme S subunit
MLSKVKNYVLPQKWSWCYLTDFTNIVMGQSPSSDTYNRNGDGIPFFQGKAEFGAVYPTIAKYCNAPNKIALAGATLLSVRAPVGPTNLVKEKCCIGRGLAAIHPIGGISSMFVLYLLRGIETDLLKEGTGSTFAAINKRFIEDLEFGLPPLPEQHRIVAKIEELFSELDKGIENLKIAQAQLKVYRQALLKHAFEGKLTAQWREENRDKLETADTLLKRIQAEREQRYRQQLAEWEAAGKQGSKPKAPKILLPLNAEELAGLPELPMEWRWSRLGNFIVSIDAGKSFKCDEREPLANEIGVAKVSAVTWGQYDESESKTCADTSKENEAYLIQLGDFILSRANTIDLVGACVIVRKVTKRIMLSDKTLRLNFDGFKQEYFLEYLRSRIGRKQIMHLSTGNQESMRNIGRDRIRSIVVPICSKIEAQVIVEVLASKLSECDQLDRTITTSLQQAETLRQSILKKAFSGQLVPQDPDDEPASALLARVKMEKSAQSHSKKARI